MLFQYSQYFQNILIIINKIGGSTFSRLNSQDKSVTIGDPFLPFYPPRDHAGSQGRFSSRQFSPSTFYASSIIVLETRRNTSHVYIYIYTHTHLSRLSRERADATADTRFFPPRVLLTFAPSPLTRS